jgi:hypothetical protein
LIALLSIQIIAHDDHAGHAGWPCLEAQAKVGFFLSSLLKGIVLEVQ